MHLGSCCYLYKTRYLHAALLYADHGCSASPDVCSGLRAGVQWLRDKMPEAWAQDIKAWQRLGATHLVVESRQGGLTFPDQHLEALRQFKNVADAILS